LIADALGTDPRIEVDSFDALLVDYARRKGVHTVLRGLRAVSDFEYEFQIANMNRHLLPDVETVFVMTGEDYCFVSARLVREVATFGGDVTAFVPPNDFEGLRRKLAGRRQLLRRAGCETMSLVWKRLNRDPSMMVTRVGIPLLRIKPILLQAERCGGARGSVWRSRQGRARQKSADRAGEVIAARVEMQRNLGEWLTKSLQGAAEPYRVEAVVRAEVRGRVREIRSRLASASPAVKIGGKSKVKLPGLGVVDGGGSGGAPLLPEISFEGGTRTSEQVSRQLETEVVKLTIMLFVDPVMPKDRREMLVKLAADLAGIDRSRGDDVVIEERPLPPAAGTPGFPTIVQATVQASPKVAYEILAVCTTALLAAAILAWGLSRRSGASSTTAVVTGGRGAEGGDEEGHSGTAAASAEVAAAQAGRSASGAARSARSGARRRVAEGSRQVIAGPIPTPPSPCGSPSGSTSSRPSSSTGSHRSAARDRAGLATAKVLTRPARADGAVAAQILQRVRNRVPLGGPAPRRVPLPRPPRSGRRCSRRRRARRVLAQAARAGCPLRGPAPRRRRLAPPDRRRPRPRHGGARAGGRARGAGGARRRVAAPRPIPSRRRGAATRPPERGRRAAPWKTRCAPSRSRASRAPAESLPASEAAVA
jgi:hypothetical protein